MPVLEFIGSVFIAFSGIVSMWIGLALLKVSPADGGHGTPQQRRTEKRIGAALLAGGAAFVLWAVFG